MTSTSPPDQREIEYYAAQANAWFNTALEHDKSILALSSAAIGLIVTVLTAIGANSQLDEWLYGAALLAFVSSVITILIIFRRNKSYLEDLVNCRESRLESELKQYDLFAISSFGLGVALVVAVGISTVVQSHERKIVMAHKMTIDEALRIIREERIIESYAGANKMRPEPEEIRSFAGAGRVAPAAQAPAEVQSPASDPAIILPPVNPAPAPKDE